MKKLFFTMTSFLLIFLFFACTKESEEEVNSFIDGKFVSSQNGNVCIWDLDWTNPRSITSMLDGRKILMVLDNPK